jgi:5-methylcytosine-specific restriction endonuclease McrA
VASELYVQVPANYGDFSQAGPGSPLLALVKYGRESANLLHLHLQMVLYSRRHRLDGFVDLGVIGYLARPATPRIAKRDALRLAEAGFIEPVELGYYVPAATEWPVVRLGSRDQIPGFIRKLVYERDGFRCTECGAGNDLTLDHIVPWSRNGPDDASNLRTLCAPCNSSKGARV